MSITILRIFSSVTFSVVTIVERKIWKCLIKTESYALGLNWAANHVVFIKLLRYYWKICLRLLITILAFLSGEYIALPSASCRSFNKRKKWLIKCWKIEDLRIETCGTPDEIFCYLQNVLPTFIICWCLFEITLYKSWSACIKATSF